MIQWLAIQGGQQIICTVIAMTMTDPHNADVLALSILELGCTIKALNQVVELVLRHKLSGEYEKLFYGHRRRSRNEIHRQHAATLTVRDLLEAYEASRSRSRSFELPGAVARKLAEAGLTQLDCVLLPSSTVSMEALRRLGKERLLLKSILVLGTLSRPALRVIQDLLKRSTEYVTVGDFISFPPSKWELEGVNYANFEQSWAKTRSKLTELGFRYEDGAFFQEGTRRAFIEKVVADENLSLDVAGIVADLAIKNGWVKPFTE